ncbi:UNVERIFIED_ORG: DNA-binding transcriptional LysR family regulator [Variovorax guangxiensis]
MDVDIAITREPLKQRGVLEVPLLDDELVAVVRPDSDSQPAGMLCLETDLTSDRIGPFIREHFGNLRRLAIYDDPRLLLDAALRGHGVTLLSRLLADEALRSGQLRHLAAYPSLPLGTLWISRTEGEPRLPLVRQVFDSLLAYSKG